MKFLKILPILMALSMNTCFGSNFEEYRAFAEKKITGWINEAKSEPIRESKRYHLDVNKIEAHFKKTDDLFHELVDIILQPDSEERYNNIDTKLKAINDHTDEFFTGAMWSSVTYNIYWVERILFDPENEYDFKNENGLPLINLNHSVIQKYIKIWNGLFDEGSPDPED